MKISKETLNVLKNLSTINSNILIKQGNVLSSISAGKNVLANIQVAESFDVDFGIYDLSQFLGVISLFSEPEITFEEKKAKISEGSRKIDYTASDASILTVPTKKINFPDTYVEFTLQSAELDKAIKTAGVLGFADIAFEGDGNELAITVSDPKNPSSNTYRVAIGETDRKFRANLKIDNLKMIPVDYKVSLSSKKISRFATEDGKIEYFVALESTSNFE